MAGKRFRDRTGMSEDKKFKKQPLPPDRMEQLRLNDEFCDAVIRCDVEKVKELFESGADINARYDEQTVLMEAVQSENPEVARFLIENGAEVNARAHDGWTPLMFSFDHLEITKLLIAKGADVNAADEEGLTVLMAAAHSDEAASILIESGADTTAKDGDGRTFWDYKLKFALQNLDWDGIKEAVEKGANPDPGVLDEETDCEDTTLILALRESKGELAKLLIEKGADVNFETSDCWTPLMFAAGEVQIEVIRLLIRNGANVNAITEDGLTPLMINPLDDEYVKLLLESGADITAKDVSGNTYWDFRLRAASAQGNLKAVADAIANGARVNNSKYLDEDDETPLMGAAEFGNKEIAEFLIQKGAEADYKTRDGRTALSLALDNGHQEVAEVLKKYSKRE